MGSACKLLIAVIGWAALSGGSVSQVAGEARNKSAAMPSEDKASPIFRVTIPSGYRSWELIAPAHRPDLDEIRAILGNVTAISAYRHDTLPFPDGTVLVKLAWKHVPSSDFPTAFVPGTSTTVQVMIKDAKKYASTGGWGFGRFIDGKPADQAQHETCFPCHQALVKDHDFVFTRLAR